MRAFEKGEPFFLEVPKTIVLKREELYLCTGRTRARKP